MNRLPTQLRAQADSLRLAARNAAANVLLPATARDAIVSASNVIHLLVLEVESLRGELAAMQHR